jgi:lysophospholipase L1-like esterase
MNPLQFVRATDRETALSTHTASDSPAIANRQTYLENVGNLCCVDWPDNRTINIVCHGHSVPSGYFKTPEVRSLDAYPNLLRIGLAERYPHAVINVIVTSIGGENSELGAKRFEKDVLPMRPDVLTIDYGLNDRCISLDQSRTAWVSMIKAAQAQNMKVLLLTPTGDVTAKLDDPKDPLNENAEQIRRLAGEYHTGLVDSLEAFQEFVKAGGKLQSLMAQENHPNRQGHGLVAKALLEWFP